MTCSMSFEAMVYEAMKENSKLAVEQSSEMPDEDVMKKIYGAIAEILRKIVSSRTHMK